MAGLVELFRGVDSLLAAPRGDFSLVGGTSLFVSLFNNLAVFIIAVAVYGFLVDRMETRTTVRRQIVVGLIFAGFVFICMHVRIPVADGVMVDQRNAIVTLAGFLGGPLAAVVAAAVGAAYRAYVGGAGVYGGIVGLGLAAIAGSVLYALRPRIESPGRLAACSVAATIFILPGFLPIDSLSHGWMLMKAMALPYGGAIAVGIFVGSLLMLNEERRREAARALRESESRYRSLFQNVLDVHFRAGRDGRLSIVSPSSEQSLGYRPSEMTGRLLSDFSANPARHAAFLGELEQRGQVRNFELDMSRKDGAIATVWVNGQRTIDSRGTPVGFDGVLRDVTQAKRDAEEKKILEESLRQRNKMQAIGEFAGGIAHDFNNMIGVIIGFTELALDELPEDSRSGESLRQIMAAGERARHLVAQILTFSRGGAAQKSAIRLDTVVQETLGFLRMTVPSSVAISADISVDPGVVLANATQVNEAVMNLASNAVHAMRSKGALSVALSAERVAAARRGRIGLFGPGDYSVIEVRDTGGGMNEALVDKAFEPFFTTKPTGEGTGMGLSVVYGIMRDHGGDIVVESRPGTGTSIRLFFPRVNAVPSPERLPVPDLAGNAERLLLVDDEPLVARFMDRHLASLGYRVTAVTDPLRALELMTADPTGFDLLITDQTMPQLTGIELARKARALNPALPVVLCTGYSSPLDQERARAEGIREICLKPTRRGDLSRAVRQALDSGATTHPSAS